MWYKLCDCQQGVLCELLRGRAQWSVQMWHHRCAQNKMPHEEGMTVVKLDESRECIINVECMSDRLLFRLFEV